jgi:choline dehydrogenase-like flavoprotein
VTVDDSYDVVIIGAGGDGPAAAKRLGEQGIETLVIEAGPWYGNENWPDPTGGPGEATTSSDPDDLSGELLDAQFTKRELEMIEKLIWGPADAERPVWFREQPEDGLVLQVAGVGGTTLHYTGCHPRAYPHAVDEGDGWLIDYGDLVPYYREVEEQLHVSPAPTTPKEELYYRGCREAGWELLETKDVSEPGFRPQPNAIVRPDERLRGDYDGSFEYPEVEGDTLAGVEIPGSPHPEGAPYAEKAKKSSAVGFVPDALATDHVTIRPNAFVTDVHTAPGPGGLEATGVAFRDTWSGDTRRVDADVVVLAAGAIETPRLWLNAGLPRNDWVGRGMTIHYGDAVVGVFDEETLENRLGRSTLAPDEGQQIAGRFDYPGLGGLQTFGGAPGTTALSTYAGSTAGFSDVVLDNGVPVDDDAPWDSRGRLAGEPLKRLMAAYERTLGIQAMTDDRPHRRNGVELSAYSDEHGQVPAVTYDPSEEDLRRRDELMEIAAEILRAAGAEYVHRLDAGPSAIHVHSTMRMGYVADEACEAYEVDRLFVADHSVLPNSLGGPNPTNTGQALATRTADRIAERYFPRKADPLA